MNFKQVKSELGKLGLSVRKTGYGSEIRVNYRAGQEATAYYTDDLEDAYNTGIVMAKPATEDYPVTSAARYSPYYNG